MLGEKDGCFTTNTSYFIGDQKKLNNITLVGREALVYEMNI